MVRHVQHLDWHELVAAFDSAVCLRQRTLKTAIRATGVGLHTGEKVYMTLRPAAANSLASCFDVSIWTYPVDVPADPRTGGRNDALGTTLIKDGVKVGDR